MLKPWRTSCAFVPLLVFSMEVLACGVRSGASVEPTVEHGRTPPIEAAAPSTDDVTVTIHMTGLILIVPSKQDGSTRMVLPTFTNHVLWLGFGLADGVRDTTSVCEKHSRYGAEAQRVADAGKAHGICYVDLDRWKLLPFGDGGDLAPPDAELSKDIVNVTDLSGGQFLAPGPADTARSITFLSGWEGPMSCSLANWTFEAIDSSGHLQNPETRPLANVVDWEIDHTTDLYLTFVDSTGVRAHVRLPRPEAERIEMILVNIPVDDLDQLPPHQIARLVAADDSAAHFHAYYGRLHRRGNAQEIPDTTRERIPHSPKPIALHACNARITVATVQPALGRETEAAFGTYACMPASGTPP